ncbi:LPS export ABC transporter permease LptF [Mergibacter septicus]|uniref:LPS export ABC transporter permease LptF n=1 Tax=Mergibacter septicus TaxID=221402 RepID=UPI001C7590CA|nr:LPS export ABC transporter permease LptF [Mergibacter septicus]QDJ13776.1 LPS export ABC transporter permease LptF [Mergibacter septicus]
MILTKYLTREVFKSQLAILFILLIIFFAQQLVRVLGSAVNGNVPTDLILPLLALGMPTMAELMLPLSLFLAILLTFGRLYAESEITVMQACGVGQRLLIKVVLILSLLTTILASINSIWINPWALNKQIEILTNAQANPNVAALSSGQFISAEDGNFVLFIDKITGNRIEGIYLFQTRQRGNVKPSVMVSENGTVTAQDNGNQRLTLNNSQRFEGNSILPEFKITHFDQYQANIGFKNQQVTHDDPTLLPIDKLLQDHSPIARAALQWRITLILVVPIMALIAVPLSRVNPRQGRFAKLLPALLLYLIFFLLQSSLKSAGVNGRADTQWLLPLVNVIFLLIAIGLNSQQYHLRIRQWWFNRRLNKQQEIL